MATDCRDQRNNRDRAYRSARSVDKSSARTEYGSHKCVLHGTNSTRDSREGTKTTEDTNNRYQAMRPTKLVLSEIKYGYEEAKTQLTADSQQGKLKTMGRCRGRLGSTDCEDRPIWRFLFLLRCHWLLGSLSTIVYNSLSIPLIQGKPHPHSSHCVILSLRQNISPEGKSCASLRITGWKVYDVNSCAEHDTITPVCHTWVGREWTIRKIRLHHN